MREKVVNLANALSASRLLSLPILIFFVLEDWREAFLIGYILVGSTDFFDGLVARRFNQKTEFGKALDSFADIFFYLGSAWFLYRLHLDYLRPNMLLLQIFLALFVLSFVVSGVVCGKPIMMHTFLLRLNAVLVYALLILSGFLDTTWFVTVILAVYLVGFVEEIVIFIRFGVVDADSPSIFHLLKEEKKVRDSGSLIP